MVELVAVEEEMRARIVANQSVTGDDTEEFKLAAIQEVARGDGTSGPRCRL